jgi:hypothetical protein
MDLVSTAAPSCQGYRFLAALALFGGESAAPVAHALVHLSLDAEPLRPEDGPRRRRAEDEPEEERGRKGPREVGRQDDVVEGERRAVVENVRRPAHKLVKEGDAIDDP